MNYLIGYKDAERNFGHEDPMLTEYTYGESGLIPTNSKSTKGRFSILS